MRSWTEGTVGESSGAARLGTGVSVAGKGEGETGREVAVSVALGITVVCARTVEVEDGAVPLAAGVSDALQAPSSITHKQTKTP